MKNEKKRIPFELALIINIILIIPVILSIFRRERSIQETLWQIIILLLAGAAWTILAMIFSKLITIKWGNFLKGWVLFQIFTIICEYILLGNYIIAVFIVFSILTVAGIIIFILFDKLWDLSFDFTFIKFAYTSLVKISGFFRRKKDIKLLKIPYFLMIIISLALIISDLVFHYMHDRVILQTFFLLLLLIVAGAACTLAAMTASRLITNRWGNLLKGWPVFQILTGIYFYLVLINDNFLRTIFFIILFILGLFLFIQYGSLWRYGFDKTILETIKQETFQPVFTAEKNAGIKSINIFDTIINGIGNILRLKQWKIILPGLAVIIILAGGAWMFFKIFTVNVISYTPKNTVPLKTEIRINLSEEVFVSGKAAEELIKENLTEYSNVGIISNIIFIKPETGIIRTEPDVKGSCRLEDSRTLIFTPEEELNPSSKYTVFFNPQWLFKKGKVILGKSYSFNTPKFEITGIRMFFNYDSINNLEKEIVGEINFNAPVNIEELRKNTTLDINEKPFKFNIESANIPTRFYIKSDKLERQKTAVNIHLSINKNLQCIHGGQPLGKKIEQTITLAEKEKLKVIDAKTWPVSGNTYIALLFNQPVSAEQIKKHVSIHPETNESVPYSVETEYCYAVFKAEFLPNKKYKINVEKEILSAGGAEMKEDFNYNVFIKDIYPDVGFSSEGNILAVNGNMDLEFSTINLDRFRVRVDKIYRNNLVYYLHKTHGFEFVKPLMLKTFEVEGGTLNERAQHYINLKKFHNIEYKGLYKITLSDPKSGEVYYDEDENNVNRYTKSKTILCTDLGIIAKQSGKDLYVQIYSILQLEPVADVTVNLVSSDNQVIRSKKTDNTGKIVFENWQEEGNEKFHPFILLAEKGEDLSYLQFSRSMKDQSRFDTGGKMLSRNEMQAYLTPDRGVYRPGEKANITAIVRNGNLSLPASVDVNLEVNDPTGLKFTSYRKTIPGNGLISFDINFPSYAKTGEYEAVLKIGDSITLGQTSLKVEEFIPDKITTDIKAQEKHTNANLPLVFQVKGIQLFGPPASGNRVRTQVKFIPREFSHPSFEGYNFTDIDRKYEQEIFDLGEDKLDDQGTKEYSLDIPKSILPPSALYAQIYAEVYDEGGRPVNTMKTVSIDPYPVYFGIKANKQDIYYVNEPIDLSLVAIDSQGIFQKKEGVNFFVKHRVYYSILRKYGQKFSYDSQPYEEPFIQTNLNINKETNYRFIPKAPGYYYVYFGDNEAMRSSIAVYVQGPGMETVDQTIPENLSISMNKEKYDAGDTASATIRSTIPGKLFFYVEREKVLYSRTVDLVDNKATITFPIQADYIPNAYISAYVIRKPDEKLKELPMSALGIKTLTVNPGNKNMPLEIESQDQTRSDKGLDIKLKLQTASSGCGVVVAAVDEGILQITQFKTPDPFNFFYTKRVSGNTFILHI